MQALRHANIPSAIEEIRVQREPLSAKGKVAGDFAATPRFHKERLWHAEIVFADAVAGPIVIGDGRFLGLGLMKPAFTHATTPQASSNEAQTAGASQHLEPDEADLLDGDDSIEDEESEEGDGA